MQRLANEGAVAGVNHGLRDIVKIVIDSEPMQAVFKCGIIISCA